MSISGKPQSGNYSDDIACAGCGAPLLSLKTTCLRCGGSAQALKSIQADVTPNPRKASSASTSFSLKISNALLEQAIILTAGLGVLFAFVNPFISTFSGADLFRSFMALAASVGLLGLKSLLSRLSR